MWSGWSGQMWLVIFLRIWVCLSLSMSILLGLKVMILLGPLGPIAVFRAFFPDRHPDPSRTKRGHGRTPLTTFH
jgi:hypothetical protein